MFKVINQICVKWGQKKEKTTTKTMQKDAHWEAKTNYDALNFRLFHFGHVIFFLVVVEQQFDFMSILILYGNKPNKNGTHI